MSGMSDRVVIDWNEIMWGAAGLTLVATVSFIVFAIMGPLEAPATMPVPPSGTNYSETE